MSDTMLHGVLNMSINLWGKSHIEEIQRYYKYQEASQRIKDLTEALIAITSRCENWETDCNPEEVSLIDEMIMLSNS
jgi:hypothetical protein